MSLTPVELARELESLLPAVARTLFPAGQPEAIAELTIAQLRVVRLVREGTTSVGALADRLSMTSSAVTQLANRLEASRLVTRVDDENDRRIKHLRLTEIAEKTMAERADKRVKRAAGVIEKLDENDRESLMSVLKKIVELGSKS